MKIVKKLFEKKEAHELFHTLLIVAAIMFGIMSITYRIPYRTIQLIGVGIVAILLMYFTYIGYKMILSLPPAKK